MESIPPSPQNSDQQTQAPHRNHFLWMVAILASCSLIVAMDFADPDLWGHVQYGREILQDGLLPETATWTFTSEGTRWINHENIAELVMALAVDTFGPLGLTIGKYIFSWIVFGLIWWRARANGVSQFVSSILCLTVAFSIQFHWHFRPQIFGYVLFGMMVALLHWGLNSHRDGSTRRVYALFGLPPLMALWANTHGSFAAGAAISVAYLGLRFIEQLWMSVKSSDHELFVGWEESAVYKLVRYATRSTERTGRDLTDAQFADVTHHEAATCYTHTTRLMDLPGYVSQSGENLLVLPGIALSICLATLLTPYGIELHFWLLNALHEPRPEIVDWESTSLFTFSRESMGLWIIGTTTLWALVGQPKRDWPKLMVFLLTALQAVSHIRHLPLLAILWAHWYAEDLERIWQGFLQDWKERTQKSGPKPKTVTSPFRHSWLMTTILGIGIVAVGASTVPRLATLHVPRDKYPVDAFKFLAENHLEGRTVVTFNWAQYAIGLFANEGMNSTVAIDGRFRTCYPQEVIDIYFDFTFGEEYTGPRNRSSKSGEINPALALTYKNPELFVLSRKQQPAIRLMEEHQADWKLLYEDALAQIWGRRDRFSKSTKQTVATQRRRDLINHPAECWPAFPTTSPVDISYYDSCKISDSTSISKIEFQAVE